MNKLNIDCLVLIFNEMEKNSLYSCLLVNKEWVNIVVPILWKKFSWNWYYHSNKGVDNSEKKLFSIILSCLSPSSKQHLSDNGIKLPSTVLSGVPLFDYIGFCEFPTYYIINKIIETVEYDTKKPENYNLLEQEIYKLFVSRCNNIKSLHWATPQPLSSFPGASTCFSQLSSLIVDIVFEINSDALHVMAHICKYLNRLTIR